MQVTQSTHDTTARSQDTTTNINFEQVVPTTFRASDTPFTSVAPKLHRLIAESSGALGAATERATTSIATTTREMLGVFGNALLHILNPAYTTIFAPAEPRQSNVIGPRGDKQGPTNVIVSPGEPHESPRDNGGGGQPVSAQVSSPRPIVLEELPSLISAHAREFERNGEIEWRPRLHDGKLSIIFREAHIRLAEKVEIISSDGKTHLATGTKAGTTADGRPIYNFDKPGAEFPDGSKVVMTFKSNGGVRTMTIPETAEKYIHGSPQASGHNTTPPRSDSSSAGEAPAVSAGGATKPSTQQPRRSLLPAGTREFEKTGEIEWRPKLNNGNLSVILRKAHDSKVEMLQILSADGTAVLANGRKAANSSDGRPVFNFDKPGASFPDEAIVLLTFKAGGGTRMLKVGETSEKLVF